MNEWISVKDKLPEIEAEVLIFDNLKDTWIAKRYYNDHIRKYYWEAKQENENCCSCIMPVFDEGERSVTHWMFPPEPPKEN